MLNRFWDDLYQKSQKIQLQQEAVAPTSLNQDLKKDAHISPDNSEWLPSPAKGVKRLLLEREGGEKTIRATSIVSYEADSRFAPHQHPLGEEFLVLSGTFSDEHGDYPAGTYVRNPPGSSHAPFSENGCMIWVKLQQFAPEDSKSVVTALPENNEHFDLHQQGLLSNVLFDDYETVSFHKALENTAIGSEQLSGLSRRQEHTGHPKGTEILLLDGRLHVNEHAYETGDWIRLAAHQPVHINIEQGAHFLMKTGHL